MARDCCISNGSLLVTTDKTGLVRDIFFPYIGLNNQLSQHNSHRIGVYVDSHFSWIGDPDWKIQVGSQDNTLASVIIFENKKLNIKITSRDIVYNEQDIFLRSMVLENTSKETRSIKIFFGVEFELNQSHSADTAYYDPTNNVLIHYKNKRVLVINAFMNGHPFSEYSTGVSGIENKEGVYRDAEDGVLQKNPIEHGPADSILALESLCDGEKTLQIDYFISIGTSLEECLELNRLVIKKTPDGIYRTTTNYWKAWIQKESINFCDLSPESIQLFNKSLFFIRSHTDKSGSIIASCDTDMLQGGKDTYTYMWPRDASYSAIALMNFGDLNASKRFFMFCNNALSKDGYLMHKYASDGSLGSSWHPWVHNGLPQIPIQEDETATVLFALYQFYIQSRDIEFIESIYNSFIKKSAEFLLYYRNAKTGLPAPSYDLWEEKFGIHTYTVSSVIGGLKSAATFAHILGKLEDEESYKSQIEIMEKALFKYLYNEKSGYFYKGLILDKDVVTEIDYTLDASSAYGVFAFGVVPPEDPRLLKAIQTTRNGLELTSNSRGMGRYTNDNYYRQDASMIGNAWVITTIWYLLHSVAIAKNKEDLSRIKQEIEWFPTVARLSGALPEQIHPHTLEAISATPLTWSHSEYVRLVLEYIKKFKEVTSK